MLHLGDSSPRHRVPITAPAVRTHPNAERLCQKVAPTDRSWKVDETKTRNGLISPAMALPANHRLACRLEGRQTRRGGHSLTDLGLGAAMTASRGQSRYGTASTPTTAKAIQRTQRSINQDACHQRARHQGEAHDDDPRWTYGTLSRRRCRNRKALPRCRWTRLFTTIHSTRGTMALRRRWAEGRGRRGLYAPRDAATEIGSIYVLCWLPPSFSDTVTMPSRSMAHTRRARICTSRRQLDSKTLGLPRSSATERRP